VTSTQHAYLVLLVLLQGWRHRLELLPQVAAALPLLLLPLLLHAAQQRRVLLRVMLTIPCAAAVASLRAWECDRAVLHLVGVLPA
jgi:hypothetical protein